MDRTEEEGAMLLAPLKDAEPSGKSGVDVTRAMRTGRRHSRRRVVVGVVAAASLTVLPLLTVPTLVRNLTEPAVTSPAGPAPAEFEILRRAVIVGTAGGYTSSSYRTGRFEQSVELKRADGRDGYGRVTVYAPGRSQPFETGVRTEDVHGQPAYWVPHQAEPTLAVMWGTDAWGIIRVSGSDADLLERAHRVAESVTFRADTPVLLPLTIPVRGPVDPLRLVGVVVVPDGAVPVQLLLAKSEETGASAVTISMGWAGPDDPGANDTVNGHQAVVNDKSVTIRDVDGEGAMVFVRYDFPEQIGGIPGLKELAKSVRLVPKPHEPQNWVGSPWY